MANLSAETQKRLKAVSLKVARRLKGFREELDQFEKDIASLGEAVREDHRHRQLRDYSEAEKQALAEIIFIRILNEVIRKGAPFVQKCMVETMLHTMPALSATQVYFDYHVAVAGEEIQKALEEMKSSNN
jgi:hypothetical protein